MEQVLTQDQLIKLICYDKDTGILTWRVYRGGRKAGSEVGRINKEGYIATRIEPKYYLSHRLAWLYVYGDWPKGQIDHINGVRSDNRISNLRDVTVSQNGQNRRYAPITNQTSKVRGVTWHKAIKKWQAQICINQVFHYIGVFITLDEAKAARELAELKLHTHSPLFQKETL